jgi:hypothetical protein
MIVIPRNKNNDHDTNISQLVIGLPPGRSYKLTGYSRGDGTNAGRIRVQNSTSVDLITCPTTLTASTEYEVFCVSFIAPANGQVKVSCYCPAIIRGTSYFDDLIIQSGQNPTS